MGLIAGGGLIGVWLVVLTILWLRTAGHYRRLTAGVDKGDLKTVLENLLNQAVKTDKAVADLVKQQLNLKEQAVEHLQKVGFVRFNPFTDTGGDQSFCLAMLDGQGNGVVISSLHSREQTRIYAKRIVAGKTEAVELSREEAEALKRAKEA